MMKKQLWLHGVIKYSTLYSINKTAESVFFIFFILRNIFKPLSLHIKIIYAINQGSNSNLILRKKQCQQFCETL